MEVSYVLEDPRKSCRIGEEVPEETHQQTAAAGVKDPPLLSVVVVATLRVVDKVALHDQFGDLMKQRTHNQTNPVACRLQLDTVLPPV